MKKANFSIKFTSELKENINQNYFSNVPIDIYHLLHNPDGTFAKIVDELEPNTMYEIEVTIKTIKIL